MSKVTLTLDHMPVTCANCPLFVNHFGHKAYCIMHAEYTKEEILEEENGNLDLYYRGCLSRRPKACPLEWTEEKETNITENSMSEMSALLAIKKDLRDEIDYKKNILYNTCVAINPSEIKGYIEGLNFAMNSLKRNWASVYGFFGDDRDSLTQEEIENLQ